MKSGYVALVGRPNVGKSTLMNSLIGQKIAITSDRPQTTRDRIETVYTDERGQIIFMDTPGIHEPRTRLGEYMEAAIRRAFDDADLIMWIREAGESESEAEDLVAANIGIYNKRSLPILTVYNKIDRFPEAFRESDDDVSYVSALTGEGLERLLDELFSRMKEGPLYFDEDTVTSIPEREIVGELIREQLLRYISDEIPHGAAVVVTGFRHEKGGCLIEADIICEKESHKGIIIGRGGSMLKKVGSAARRQIEEELGSHVRLKLFVKVRRKWRDSDTLLREYGYDRRKL